jgi:hypothetical protein
VIWEKLGYWVARYIDLDHPWGDGKYIPAYYLDWLFWQFSARGTGRGAEFGAQSKSIDLDYFNGDQAAFDAVFGEISPLVQVSANWAVSLRGGPTGSAIGATWKGSTWPVLGVSEDGEYYRVEAWLKKKSVKEI